MALNTALMYQSIPHLARGMMVSLQVTLLSALIGFLLGTLIGYLHTQKNGILRTFINVYVGIIRGTPMLIQITFFYYVLPVIGIELSAFAAAVLAIGINSSAYISQMVRSGIMSIGNEQIEAGKVLGLTTLQITWHIILPQAFRVILPALVGESSTLIKDSSLASAIGVMELYKESRAIMHQSYEVISIFVLVALFYLTMTTVIECLGKYLERKMNWYVKN